jgi:sterol 3beta-glucosyltransferase
MTMKITLLTYGSRGDVQPYAALALGLQKAGHTVKLAAPHRFAGFAAEHGLPFVPLAGDPEEISKLINDAGMSPPRMLKGMMDYVFSIAGDVARAAFAACGDADLVVHSFLFTTGGHSVARARGIPDISVQAFPMFAPTRAFPNVALANVPPGAFSYFTHWLATQIFWYGGNSGYKQLRRLAPDVFSLKLYWPFAEKQPIQTPLLMAYSPTVIPQPRDWTAPHIHTVGYFFLDAAEAYTPPQALTDFLAAGDAPVCVTFGSMINQEAERIYSVVRMALKQTRQRGIILTGWGGIESAEYTDLFHLEAAPHDWLFPRCKTVVHHGGAGTTAAGLRAGIPNIIVPHGVDQPFWGKRVAAIGAGPTPLDLKKLSVASLTAAFAGAESSALRARAQEVGRLIRSEDGVTRAVELIEEHVAQFSKLRYGRTV